MTNSSSFSLNPDSVLTKSVHRRLLRLLEQHSSELFLEPLLSLILGDLVRASDLTSLGLLELDSSSSSGQDNEEVHSKDASLRVILDSQVDVLLNAEAKAAGVREVASSKLVILHFKASLEEILSLVASDSGEARDFLVSLDAEGTDGVSGLAFKRVLTSQVGDNLGCLGESVTTLSCAQVDDKFVDTTEARRFNLHKLPYNPLSLFGETPMLPVHTARGFSETMSKAFGLGQKQQLRLRKLIADAYESAGISKSNPNTWTNYLLNNAHCH